MKRIEAGEDNVDICEADSKKISATGPVACAILDRIMKKKKKKS